MCCPHISNKYEREKERERVREAGGKKLFMLYHIIADREVFESSEESFSASVLLLLCFHDMSGTRTLDFSLVVTTALFHRLLHSCTGLLFSLLITHPCSVPSHVQFASARCCTHSCEPAYIPTHRSTRC